MRSLAPRPAVWWAHRSAAEPARWSRSVPAVLLGALLGSEVGRSLDKADQAYAAQSYQNTLEATPTGETTTWVNPDSGNGGSYTPTKTYQVDSGQYCREFQQTITVGGQTEDAYGTACREPDGSWRIVGN